MRVLYVYRWATMGGVERVLLNRAKSFQRHGLAVAQDVHFLSDGGGLAGFSRAIQAYGVTSSLGMQREFRPQGYDCLIAIDTPEVLNLERKEIPLWFECHTAYAENRQYLQHLPEEVCGILTPSQHFAQQLMQELPEPWRDRVLTLRNGLPPYQAPDLGNRTIPRWNKRLIAYVGRIDALKNTDELIQAAAYLRKRQGDHYLLLFVGPTDQPEMLWKKVEKQGLLDRFVYLPPVPFERVSWVWAMIRENRGLFASASQGESFGLSAAEAISAGLPVVLSDAHRDLVAGETSVLYPLGDPRQAAEKIAWTFAHYEAATARSQALQSLFSEAAFLQDWQQFQARIRH